MKNLFFISIFLLALDVCKAQHGGCPQEEGACPMERIHVSGLAPGPQRPQQCYHLSCTHSTHGNPLLSPPPGSGFKCDPTSGDPRPQYTFCCSHPSWIATENLPRCSSDECPAHGNGCPKDQLYTFGLALDGQHENCYVNERCDTVTHANPSDPRRPPYNSGFKCSPSNQLIPQHRFCCNIQSRSNGPNLPWCGDVQNVQNQPQRGSHGNGQNQFQRGNQSPSCFEYGIAYIGGGITRQRNVQDENDCQKRCFETTECEYWNYNKNRKVCYLKRVKIDLLSDQRPNPRPDPRNVFGPKVCP